MKRATAARRPDSKQRRRPATRATRATAAAALIMLLTIALLARRRRRSLRTPLPHDARRSNVTGEDILSRVFAANIIVSEVNQLIFCPVPKAANSNWKYLLRKWEGLPDYADLTAAHSPLRSGLRYLSDYSAREVEQLLSDPRYFRFVFVRDPYTRLVSCYMDKFRNEDPAYVRREYRAFLAQVFSWYHVRRVDIEKEPRPSFRSFVDELLKHAPDEMNAHWRPQTAHCGVGMVPYDFVGRMERLQQDVQYVFDKIGRPNEHFPSQEEIGFPPSGASKAVADILYTVDLMFKVRVVYDDDFRLLGYV